MNVPVSALRAVEEGLGAGHDAGLGAGPGLAPPAPVNVQEAHNQSVSNSRLISG